MSIKTVEMVGKGHPDKVADQISDAILDYVISTDAKSRVAIETLLKNDEVIIAGELTTNAFVNDKVIKDIVSKVFKEVKYTYKPKIKTIISKQSSDIALGVDTDGAGDQGMVFGYATKETSNRMPLVYNMTRELMKLVDDCNSDPRVLGDGKCQITVDDDNKIVQLVISKQNTFTNEKDFRKFIDVLFDKTVDVGKGKTTFRKMFSKNVKIYINPTGKFEIGGPFGDTGLTGRKIIVDTYGGLAHHGGGAFSGKDLTKVDRSGAYFARQLAKEVVDLGLAKEVEIRMSFVIGVNEIADITTTYCDNGKYKKIDKFLKERTKGITVKEMINHIDPINSFEELARYGHFK